MNAKQSRFPELEDDLKASFREFYHFAIDIITQLEENSNKLKFAVVNMQVALELFLKYYFLKKGKYEWLFSDQSKPKFREFSDILNRFFSKDSKLLVTKKQHLQKILEARNRIVHQGKNNWPDELIINLVNTSLFIQNVLNREFGETLLKSSHMTNDNLGLSENLLWRQGAEDFAGTLAHQNGMKAHTCWFCYSTSFLDKRIFSCDELEEDGFQCATCLNTFYIGHQIGLAKCVCQENTFILDILNPNNDLYRGRCLECDYEDVARKCEACEAFFLENCTEDQTAINGLSFCSHKCLTDHSNRSLSKLN